DAGARQIGVSVFKDCELTFYAVKTIRAKNQQLSIARMKRIISELLQDHEITHVALERVVFVQQHRTFVKIVFEELRGFLKKQNVIYREYNPKAIRQAVCENEKGTKTTTARILAMKYPELARYFNVEKIWQKQYFAHLLDAVAVGY